MSNIPFARECLQDLVAELRSSSPPDPVDAASIIDQIVSDYMVRDSHKPRTPNKSVKMTAKLAAQIRAYAKRNPHVPAQHIANLFKVNPGRVSEAIAGKW